ncbi:MAG: hypothetical protein LBM70_00530 [Victivallales bacterium]|jgi:hypothetical protein|nr:hypothetical protein [Victivallales bacterium]
MILAKENFDKKHKAFSEKVKNDFPQASEEIYSVNFGTRGFSSYRAEENTFTPTVAKVLIIVIPPDENMALRLLDCGVKSGLVPFCGMSHDGTFGAVFFRFERLRKRN